MRGILQCPELRHQYERVQNPDLQGPQGGCHIHLSVREPLEQGPGSGSPPRVS